MSEPDKKKQRQAPLHLAVKLLGEDDFKFVNDSFSLQVFLQDESGSLKTGGADVLLKLALVFEDQPANEPQPTNGKGLLVVEGKGGAVIKNGRAEVKVKITDVSMNYDNRKFCIVATSSQNLPHISPGKSQGVTVIKHRLVLAKDPSVVWETDWYKDEGGRDKSIPLNIELLDARGRPVKDRHLPLKVTLHYEKTFLAVTNQEYLKLSPDSEVRINDEGKASLRVRVEDVSKNHQGQAFVISVGPDPTEPLDHDVQPAFSESVTVKSKRNKRRNRDKDPMDMSSPPARHSTAAVHMTMSDVTASTPHAAAAAAAPVSRDLGAGGGGGEGEGEVNESLKTIFKWINKVLTDLPNMRWEQIPATRNPDGSTAMPKHIMPYPNDHIADIIQVYQLEVMGSLQVVLNQLEAQEQAAAEGGGGGGGGGDPMDSSAATSGAAEDLSASSSSSSSAMNGAGGIERLGADDPSGGLGPMPPQFAGLQRQESNNYFGPGTSSANELPIWHGSDQTYTDNGVTESNVWFIVAKVFTLKHAQIGCPAFDVDKNLLGFFNERENDNSHAATDIDFIPLASLRGVAKPDLEVAEQSLKAEISRASPCVFSIDGHNNDLNKTKEAAMMYIWTKKSGEIGADLDDGLFDLLNYRGDEADGMQTEV